MSDLLSDLIFKNNLSAFSYKLWLRNETSHTVYTKSNCILIRELKEDGLVLEIKSKVCQKGHNLTLFFLNENFDETATLPLTGHLKDAAFEAIAKVTALEICNLEKQHICVDLHFTQYKHNNWKNILKLYEKNQEQLNELLQSQRLIKE